MRFYPFRNMRRAAVALLAACCSPLLGSVPAWAGDSAQLQVIGYSADGKVFGFEEYGIQDGSGFAYSHIFLIDTDTDKFVAGTPIKVLVEDEMSLGKIRGLARTKAQPLIERYQLDNDPGVLAAYNPVSEADSDPHTLRYYPFPADPPRSQTYRLALTQKPLPAPKTCLNMVGTYSGFSLTFTEVAGESATQQIYEDKQVPASRNCPNGYRLAAIVTSETASAPTMAMIQVSTFGFEGNDQRWIAIPISPLERP
jgi:predicted secreted protein